MMKALAISSAMLFAALPAVSEAAIVFAIDLDTSITGIQSTRSVNNGQQFDAQLVLSLTDNSKTSGYFVSVRFDTGELDLQNVLSTAPSPFFELVPFTQTDPLLISDPQFASSLGQINSINASNFFGSLDAPATVYLATFTILANSPITNGNVDILPGFYVSGVDGINDENSLPITSGITFQGGTINASAVPEPSSLALLGIASVSFTWRRRRRGIG